MATNISLNQKQPAQSSRGLLDIPTAIAGLAVASALGGWITAGSIDSGWYASLAKSSLNPPNMVFGPVWTTLYILMFFAFVNARKASPIDAIDYKVVFGVNLAINLLWSVVFFGYTNVTAGFWVIVAYLFTCVATAMIFGKYSSRAAWMIVPLIAWVSFAGYLNFVIMRLN
ncbi:MAG TPA: TspO/MBR family protein [Fimbriimonas sp.]|nr:TspO/MBR family protein [Fimbriimonas sp.]